MSFPIHLVIACRRGRSDLGLASRGACTQRRGVELSISSRHTSGGLGAGVKSSRVKHVTLDVPATIQGRGCTCPILGAWWAVLGLGENTLMLAHAIDAAQHSVKKENQEDKWLRETAEALKIEVNSHRGFQQRFDYCQP